MAIGLPAQLRPRTVSDAYSHAAHAVAGICLLSAAGLIATMQVDDPTVHLWPALLALLPLLALLQLVDRFPRPAVAAGFVLIGSVSVYWCALGVLSAYPETGSSDAFIPSMLRVALGLVALAGTGTLGSIAWTFAGLGGAEIAIDLAAVEAGVPVVFDRSVIILVGLSAVTILATGRTRRSARQAQPGLQRAADEESLAATRRDIEARAAAVLHDTVLGHLAVVASTDGALRAETRARIRDDLAMLADQAWLDDPARAESAAAPSGALATAVRDARDLGLTVELSGDLDVLDRVGPRAAAAVGQAVWQCLVNVARHAGTDRAEIVVSAAAEHISVLVIDGGRGFAPDQVAPDRLGLRQSVRRRIDAVGGSVDIWSAPGRGTTVVLRLPDPSALGSVR